MVHIRELEKIEGITVEEMRRRNSEEKRAAMSVRMKAYWAKVREKRVKTEDANGEPVIVSGTRDKWMTGPADKETLKAVDYRPAYNLGQYRHLPLPEDLTAVENAMLAAAQDATLDHVTRDFISGVYYAYHKLGGHQWLLSMVRKKTHKGSKTNEREARLLDLVFGVVEKMAKSGGGVVLNNPKEVTFVVKVPPKEKAVDVVVSASERQDELKTMN